MPALGSPPAYPLPYTAPTFATGVTKEQELEMLKGQAEYFEDTLEGIKKRIEDLETKAKK